MNHELLPLRLDADAIAAYVRLFAECFPSRGKFNAGYIEWLYQQNPFGRAVGYDAWDGAQLAAHYVLVPIDVWLEGRRARALLSLNTATHPQHQGRGLFTKLAERTYATAADQGYELVFGVANANSTPGFVRKLGFQLVEPLSAKIGVGGLGIDTDEVVRRAQFRTAWSEETLAWRCGNPNNRVWQRAGPGKLQLYARAMTMAIPVYAELASTGLPPLDAAPAPPLSPMRLYVGLEPRGLRRARAHVDIPQKLRPSPLNFIYKPLSAGRDRLEPGHTSFSFIDFDAY